MVISGYGYDQVNPIQQTEILDPFNNLAECNNNTIKGFLKYTPFVTNGKYSCASDGCTHLVQVGPRTWIWNETNIKIPTHFNISIGSASVLVGSGKWWWITNGWMEWTPWNKWKPNPKTILLHENETQFTDGPDLPAVMYDHCMATINETTVLIAGNSFGDGCKDSFFVDVSSFPFKFKAKKTLNICRSGAACGVLVTYKGMKNVPIIAGGDFAKEKITTEVFDIQKQEWIMGPNLIRPYSDGGYITKGDKFILLGGRFYSNKYKSMQVYNNVRENFELLEGELKGTIGDGNNAERAGFSAAIVDNNHILCTQTCC